MNHVFELSDEHYEMVRRLAEAEGRTPEDLFLAWTSEVEDRYRREHPTYYETNAWLRHLGATDEQIREAERLP